VNRIWGFLFLSFALHVFSGTVATVLAPKSYNSRHQTTTVELLDVEPKKKSQEDREAKNFAGRVRVPESMKVKTRVKKDWDSDQEITVLEQTVAEKTGLTENRTLTEKKGGGMKSSVRERAVADLKSFSHGDFNVKKGETTDADIKPLTLPTIGGESFAQGDSTFAYQAPNIKKGKITALNTDRFVYFGFYQRAEEMVYPQWANFTRAAVDTYLSTHRVFGNKTFSARYEVLLRPDGTYEKSLLRESSGVGGIDLALAQAFKKAKQIPHPPEEMIKEDGYIHMDYTINVEVGPNQLADADEQE
jgi:hypothetical protein